LNKQIAYHEKRTIWLIAYNIELQLALICISNKKTTLNRCQV